MENIFEYRLYKFSISALSGEFDNIFAFKISYNITLLKWYCFKINLYNWLSSKFLISLIIFKYGVKFSKSFKFISLPKFSNELILFSISCEKSSYGAYVCLYELSNKTNISFHVSIFDSLVILKSKSQNLNIKSFSSFDKSYNLVKKIL